MGRFKSVAKQKEVFALARKEVEREFRDANFRAKKDRYIAEIAERKTKLKYDREIEDMKRRYASAQSELKMTQTRERMVKAEKARMEAEIAHNMAKLQQKQYVSEMKNRYDSWVATNGLKRSRSRERLV